MTYFRENIEKAAGYTPGFQPKDAGVTKLNTNENPFPPSPKALEAAKNIEPEKLRKYPDPLADDFRKAAAGLLDLSPDYIMCCNGGDDLLKIALQSFCDQNRPVAYPTPTYSLYPVLAQIQNCKTIEIPFDDEFNLPPKLAGADAALTIICNPNAPTASFINPDEIASLADESDAVVLVDEAYIDFAEDNCIRLIKDFDNLIILRSMSKGYSLAGLRFGYAVAQPSLIKGLLKVKDSYNIDAVAAAAAAQAIEDQKYFSQNIKKIKQQRKYLTEKLRMLNFKVPESNANFVLAECKKQNAKQIYQQLAKQNIYVRYFDLPQLNDKLRITVGTKEQNQKLIAALNDII